jgi:hypothetical protein
MERGYCQKLASKSSPMVKLLARGNKVRLPREPIQPSVASNSTPHRVGLRPKFQGSSIRQIGTDCRRPTFTVKAGYNGRARTMMFRWRLWTRFRRSLRKRPVPSVRKPPVPSSCLPYELDEFAELLSSRDPAALRQLAAGLARGEGRHGKLQA